MNPIELFFGFGAGSRPRLLFWPVDLGAVTWLWVFPCRLDMAVCCLLAKVVNLRCVQFIRGQDIQHCCMSDKGVNWRCLHYVWVIGMTAFCWCRDLTKGVPLPFGCGCALFVILGLPNWLKELTTCCWSTKVVNLWGVYNLSEVKKFNMAACQARVSIGGVHYGMTAWYQ